MKNPIIEKAVSLIEAQQAKVQYHSNQWAVGEQLKGICLREPKSAELIFQDLQVEEMSIVEAEKKVKAFADKRRKGNSSNVSLFEAEDILREFYGLPDPGDVPQPMPEPVPAPPPPAGAGGARPQVSGGAAQAMKPDSGIIDLMDFL